MQSVQEPLNPIRVMRFLLFSDCATCRHYRVFATDNPSVDADCTRVKGDLRMRLHELSREQIRELKIGLLWKERGTDPVDHVNRIDAIVSDLELYDEYGDTEFDDSDFACTAPF